MARAGRATAGRSQELARIAAMDLATLRACWQAHHGTAAPSGLSARLLRLALSREVQAAEAGGETAAQRRAWTRIEVARAAGASPVEAIGGVAPTAISEGTRLIRFWGGRSHEVIVHAEHVAWQGRRYRSLSAVARAITGTNRNGPAFFGLRDAGACR